MLDNILVIVDPGHGGTDTGAVANGYKEKDLNLKVSIELVGILEMYIKNIIMTREEDLYLDLRQRAEWVAKKADEFEGQTICLSEHFNAWNGNARGCETIHSMYAKPELATSIVNKIYELGIPLRRVFSRESTSSPGKDYYAMHRRTGGAQTVIIESLFLDNSEDIQFLKRTNFIKTLAEKHAEGLLQYLGVAPLHDNDGSHWAKQDNDELMAAGILNDDHTDSLDEPATEGMVIALINRVRKECKDTWMDILHLK